MSFFNKHNPTHIYTLFAYLALVFSPVFFGASLAFLSEGKIPLWPFLIFLILFPFLIGVDLISRFIHERFSFMKALTIFKRQIIVTILLISGLLSEWIYLGSMFVPKPSASLAEYILIRPHFLFSIIFLLIVSVVFLMLMAQGKTKVREIALNPRFRN